MTAVEVIVYCSSEAAKESNSLLWFIIQGVITGIITTSLTLIAFKIKYNYDKGQRVIKECKEKELIRKSFISKINEIIKALSEKQKILNEFYPKLNINNVGKEGKIERKDLPFINSTLQGDNHMFIDAFGSNNLESIDNIWSILESLQIRDKNTSDDVNEFLTIYKMSYREIQIKVNETSSMINNLLKRLHKQGINDPKIKKYYDEVNRLNGHLNTIRNTATLSTIFNEYILPIVQYQEKDMFIVEQNDYDVISKVIFLYIEFENYLVYTSNSFLNHKIFYEKKRLELEKILKSIIEVDVLKFA